MVNLISDLGTSKHDLATHEDQKNDLGLDHAIDETWEQLWLVRAEVVVTRSKTLQTNGELDVARTNDVLDFEVGKLSVEACVAKLAQVRGLLDMFSRLTEFLDDPGVLAAGKFGIILGLRTSDYHLARSEDQGGCFWFADTHDNSSETLGVCDRVSVQPRTSSNTLVLTVLSIASMQSNGL